GESSRTDIPLAIIVIRILCLAVCRPQRRRPKLTEASLRMSSRFTADDARRPLPLFPVSRIRREWFPPLSYERARIRRFRSRCLGERLGAHGTGAGAASHSVTRRKAWARHRAVSRYQNTNRPNDARLSARAEKARFPRSTRGPKTKHQSLRTSLFYLI